jgi:protein-disulfide isomerase
VNELDKPAARGTLASSIMGGIIGSAVTAAALIVGAPHMVSTRIVRDGLLSSPQILSEAAEALRDAQYKPVLAQHRAAIELPFASSWKGAAKPAVTLVEFYDYACPYCKASNPIVDRLLQEHPDLRIVYRELPILGPDSVTAARLSLAASKAGRFAQFHDAQWTAGRPSEQTTAAAAQVAGIGAQPKPDPQIEAELKQNFQLAGQLGATGTPVFIIGDRVLNGAVGYDMLSQAIAAARKKA